MSSFSGRGRISLLFSRSREFVDGFRLCGFVWGGVGRPDQAALHAIREVFVCGFSRHVPCCSSFFEDVRFALEEASIQDEKAAIQGRTSEKLKRAL